MEKVSLYVGYLLLKNPKGIVFLTSLGKAVGNLYEIVEYIRKRIIGVHCVYRVKVIEVKTDKLNRDELV